MSAGGEAKSAPGFTNLFLFIFSMTESAMVLTQGNCFEVRAFGF